MATRVACCALAVLALSACRAPTEAAITSQYFTFYGQVLNGPVCIRLLANDQQYELTGLVAGVVLDTTQVMRVVARYETQHTYVSNCNVGPVLDVISIGPAR